MTIAMTTTRTARPFGGIRRPAQVDQPDQDQCDEGERGEAEDAVQQQTGRDEPQHDETWHRPGQPPEKEQSDGAAPLHLATPVAGPIGFRHARSFALVDSRSGSVTSIPRPDQTHGPRCYPSRASR